MPLWPLVVYFIVVIILVLGMLGTAYVLGERHHEASTDTPYESGMEPTGSARLRFPAEFYLIGMFFVIFDLESVFTFAWALAAKDPAVRWAGFIEIAAFIVILLFTLIYLWRVGALDWGTSRRLQTAIAEKGAPHGTLP